MDAKKLLLLVCTLAVLYTERSSSVPIRKKRSWDSVEGRNDLAKALSAIKREKRRLNEEQFYQDDGGYDDMGDMGYYDDPYYEPRQQEVDDFLGELFDNEDEYGQDEEPSYKPYFKQYHEEHDDGPVHEVDTAELEDIFKPEDNGATEEKGSKLSKDQVATLLDSAGGIETANVKNTQTQGEKHREEEQDGVMETEDDDKVATEQEINDIFKDDDGNQVQTYKNEKVQVENDLIEDTPEEQYPSYLNKEWLLDQYLRNDDVSVKRKRSSSNDFLVSEEDDEEEEALTVEDCLRGFLALMDDENTHLAEALNLATIAQVERSDRFIPDEIEMLRNAVVDEKRMKLMTQCATVLRLPMAAPTGDNSIYEDKRGEPTYPLGEEEIPDMEDTRMEEADFEGGNEGETEEENEELMQKLRDFIIQSAILEEQSQDEENEIENDLDDEDVDDLPVENYYMHPFYRELWKTYNMPMSDSDGYWYARALAEDELDDEDEGEEEELPYEVADEDLIDEDGEEEEEVMSQYLSELSAGERRELADVLEEVIEKTEEEMCPAIGLLTDNCEYARGLGLALDDEAMSLCNRHQLCYTCGGEHGLSLQACDAGFLAETDRICGPDDTCSDEAAGLFVLMLESHQKVVTYDTQALCSAQCVEDYITGLMG